MWNIIQILLLFINDLQITYHTEKQNLHCFALTLLDLFRRVFYLKKQNKKHWHWEVNGILIVCCSHATLILPLVRFGSFLFSLPISPVIPPWVHPQVPPLVPTLVFLHPLSCLWFLCKLLFFSFIFYTIYLANAFIQSDLQLNCLRAVLKDLVVTEPSLYPASTYSTQSPHLV